MTDFEVGLRLTADGRAVVTTSRAVSKEMDGLARSTDRAGKSAERAGQQSVRFGAGVRQAGTDTRRAATDVVGLNKQLVQLRTIAAGVAGISIIGGIGAGIRQATRESLSFSDAMAEVSTLIQGSAAEMDKLTAAVREQSKEFGKTPTQQANALYQIISAGARDADEAIRTLDASNRLALGGVTDVATAADGLTTILNSYGKTADQATSVSDALFTAMRLGKTTIGELATGIGNVAAFAAQAGVSIEEVLAAVAALTKNGIQTDRVMTGLNQVFVSITKVQQQARDEAKRLGLDFSATALQAKGLAGFLADVIDKTGGSTESLGKLFPDVQALVPVLSLAGQAGGDFAEALGEMEVRAGATSIALHKINEALGTKYDKSVSTINDHYRELADTLATDYVDALEKTAKNLDTLETAATSVAILLAGRFTASLSISALTSFVAANRAAIAGMVLMGRVAPVAAAGMTTLGVAAASARGALALLGGPVGIAVAAASAMYIYRDSLFAAITATDDQEGALQRLNDRMEESLTLNQQQAAAALLDAQAQQALTQAMRAQLELQLRGARADAEAAAGRVAAQARPTGFLGTSAAGVGAQAEAARASAKVRELEQAISSLDTTIAGNVKVLDTLRARLAEVKGGLDDSAAAADKQGTAVRAAADDADAFAKSLANLIGQLDPLAGQITQYVDGITTLSRAYSEGTITGERYAALVQKLGKEVLPTNAQALEKIHQQMQEEARLLGMSAQAREVEAAVRARVLELKAKGIELSAKEIEQLRGWIAAQQEASRASEKRAQAERDAAEQVKDIWQQARRSIQSTVADVIYDALDGQIDDVQDLADRFVEIWKRAYADAFAANLFQGFSQSGQSPIPGLGALFGQQGPGSGSGSGGSVPTVKLDDSSGLGKALGGLQTTLDDLGSHLGFAPAAPKVGPPVAGQTLTKGLGAAAGATGNAFAAYQLGGMAGDALGFGSRGSSIAAGAAAGAVYGSVIPVIGTAVGALIGAVLGGLLSDGHATPSTGADLTGDTSGGVRSQAGASASNAVQLRQAVNLGLGAIADTFGTGLSPRGFGIIAQREGDPFSFRSSSTPFGQRQKFATADEAVLAAIKEGVRAGVVTGLDDRANTVIQNSKASTPQQLLEDLNFVGTYEQLTSAGKQTSQYVDQLKSLNRTYVDAIKKANELGLATQDLADARERSVSQIRDNFDRQTKLAILDITDPVRAALERQQDQAKQYLLDAAAVGADLSQARRKVNLERQQLIDELTAGAQKMADTFRTNINGILDEIRYGKQSGLSDQERLPVLLARFQDLVAKAPTDEAARSGLDAAVQDLLDVAGNVFASSKQFFDIQRLVEQELQQLSNTGIAAPDVQAIADQVGQIQLDPAFQGLMEDIGNEIATSNQEVVDVLNQIRDALLPTTPGSPSTSPIPGYTAPNFNVPGLPNYYRVPVITGRG